MQGKSTEVIENPVLYVITDPMFDDFEVLNTANGWWKERIKVESLIQGYKWGFNDVEARANAGISKAQYDYFLEVHEKFSEIIAACVSRPKMAAKMKVAKKLEDISDDDADFALNYLTKASPDEFMTKNKSEVTLPVTAQQVIEKLKEEAGETELPGD